MTSVIFVNDRTMEVMYGDEETDGSTDLGFGC